MGKEKFRPLVDVRLFIYEYDYYLNVFLVIFAQSFCQEPNVVLLKTPPVMAYSK